MNSAVSSLSFVFIAMISRAFFLIKTYVCFFISVPPQNYHQSLPSFSTPKQSVAKTSQSRNTNISIQERNAKCQSWQPGTSKAYKTPTRHMRRRSKSQDIVVDNTDLSNSQFDKTGKLSFKKDFT